MQEFSYIDGVCPVGAAIGAIGGKWKIAIVWALRNGTLRFGELHKAMPKGVSQSVLTSQLRDLEKDGIVHREVFKEIPPKVEYSLTQHGEELIPFIVDVATWREGWLLKRQP